MKNITQYRIIEYMQCLHCPVASLLLSWQWFASFNRVQFRCSLLLKAGSQYAHKQAYRDCLRCIATRSAYKIIWTRVQIILYALLVATQRRQSLYARSCVDPLSFFIKNHHWLHSMNTISKHGDLYSVLPFL